MTDTKTPPFISLKEALVASLLLFIMIAAAALAGSFSESTPTPVKSVEIDTRQYVDVWGMVRYDESGRMRKYARIALSNDNIITPTEYQALRRAHNMIYVSRARNVVRKATE